MIKIIETNTTLEDFTGELLPIDTQSRVIEVSSWEVYIDEIKYQKQVNKRSIIGYLIGVSFPKGATMKTFTYDDRRLMCTFNFYDGKFGLKTAYICENSDEMSVSFE